MRYKIKIKWKYPKNLVSLLFVQILSLWKGFLVRALTTFQPRYRTIELGTRSLMITRKELELLILINKRLFPVVNHRKLEFWFFSLYRCYWLCMRENKISFDYRINKWTILPGWADSVGFPSGSTFWSGTNKIPLHFAHKFFLMNFFRKHMWTWVFLTSGIWVTLFWFKGIE